MVKIFEGLALSQVLLKVFPKYSRNRTEGITLFSNTCLEFIVIFRKIVIIFLVRNTPNNKFLDDTKKETNKVM